MMYSRTLRSMRSPTRVRGSRSAGLNSRVTAEGNKQRLGLGCLLHPLPSLVEPESTGRCKTDECVCFDMQVDHRHWCPSQAVGGGHVYSCKCVARVRTRDERVSITWPASPRTIDLSHTSLTPTTATQRQPSTCVQSRNARKTRTSRLRCYPYQRSPCRHQTLHRPDVRLTLSQARCPCRN